MERVMTRVSVESNPWLTRCSRVEHAFGWKSPQSQQMVLLDVTSGLSLEINAPEAESNMKHAHIVFGC